ncbi:MAG: AcvB/VirJ family lysyl-phosphatidylglycerol hydrolase [Steroidobacteraceae bacterium]
MKSRRTPRALATAAAAAAALCGMVCAARALAAPGPPARASAPTPAALPDHVSHGRFQNVAVTLPRGTPRSMVLLLAGEGGANTAADLALVLARRGAMVAVIDVSEFDKALAADAADCVFPDGDLENLSHFIQAYYHLPIYRTPLLVGYGTGANLAYAALAQAPVHTFAGAITVGFCPTTSLRKPLCKGGALNSERTAGGGLRYLPAPELDDPWVTLQVEPDGECGVGAIRDFTAHMPGAAVVALPAVGGHLENSSRWLPSLLAAFDTLVERTAREIAPPAPVALGNLPVIEVPARTGSPPAELLAIILSGDGGWAGLDKEVAQALAEHGIPVAGLDSLRYFWSARTPQGLAGDIDRMIRYYIEHFGGQRVLLIGYSQGADVLPFAVNRLAPATRTRIALAVLMGMSEHAVFEFHVSNWISNDNSGPATLPEVNRITGIPVLCIYGEGDNESLCPKLDADKVRIVKLPGGHHFNGDYAGLAREILAAAAR